jgi:uncharacterized protein (TIGR03435 family)
MKIVDRLVWHTLVVCVLCTGQSRPLAFEVASVKRSPLNGARGIRGGPGTSDPGRYSFNSATLLDLIAQSYDVEYFQIVGSTQLDRDRFDVAVIIPAGTTMSDFRIMLRGLLAERFGLEAHLERRDLRAYELAVARTGTKLREASEATSGADEKPGITAKYSVVSGRVVVHIAAVRASIESLLQKLRSSVDLPIVNGTELSGRYSFVLDFAKDLSGTDSDALLGDPPSLVSAVQQQLGLRIVTKKVPFNVVVVDHVSRNPIEN